MGMLKMNWGVIGTSAETVLTRLSRLFLYLPFSWRGLSALILGILLANWFWILFAPHTTFTSIMPERAASVEAGRLFGVTSSNETAIQGVALPNVQLLGVFAATGGKPSFAILKLDNNRQKGVAEGEEVSSGTKLIVVHADHVLLERAGVQQRVDLESRQAGAPGDTMPPEPKPDTL